MATRIFTAAARNDITRIGATLLSGNDHVVVTALNEARQYIEALEHAQGDARIDVGGKVEAS